MARSSAHFVRFAVVFSNKSLRSLGKYARDSSRPVSLSKNKNTPVGRVFIFWRRTRDSNPRGCYTLLAFQASSLATRSILQDTFILYQKKNHYARRILMLFLFKRSPSQRNIYTIILYRSYGIFRIAF